MTKQEKPKKIRINLYVDPIVAEYFKHKGATEEVPYQPLMNKVLRDYVNSLPPEERYHNR